MANIKNSSDIQAEIKSIHGISVRPEDALSYASFLWDRRQFQRSGTAGGETFNIFDTPGHYYFRILFHFYNGDGESANGLSGGLLAPTWLQIGNSEEYFNYNSAWAYLKMNGEEQRADLLQQFVHLLSNISTYSPWYFSEISGLEEALTRSFAGNGADRTVTITADRPKITIKCLPDAYDMRIATLLSLYRSVTWSWHKKCEIIPANLRKFDMSVYVFNVPVRNMHSSMPMWDGETGYASVNPYTGNYETSYKLYEFHNCEFDYNSISTASALNNADGSNAEYSININFDDVYERHYNETLMRHFGDAILLDLATVSTIDKYNQPEYDDNEIKTISDKLLERSDYYEDNAWVADFNILPTIPEDNEAAKKAAFNRNGNIFYNSIQYGKPAKRGLFGNIAAELVGTALDAARGLITHVALGNLHTLSLTRVMSQANAALQGHLFSTAGAVYSYLEDQKKAETKYVDKIGQIMQANTLYNNI